MKKTFTIHGVATIFVFGLLGAPSIAADDIKIGVMAPLTGNVAYWGNNVLLGAQMAADEINSSGGVNGSKIQLVSLDTAGDKAQAVSVIKKLIDSGVLVIVGTPTSGETFAVGPIANQAKVVYISPGATAAGVGKIGPFVFKNTLDDTVGAPLAVQVHGPGKKDQAGRLSLLQQQRLCRRSEQDLDRGLEEKQYPVGRVGLLL